MCGISGVYSFGNNMIKSSILDNMNNIIQHRGPDGHGVFTGDKVGLGSTRLSIIDLREISNMPMEDSQNRYLIVYNGEIFNYKELREDLLTRGHEFKTDSDTEVILNSYKEWGEDCLHKFNGMWAFALWDKDAKKLFCSRDRYGIKPFYYYRDDDVFMFGSEIKQLLKNGADRSLNDNIIYDYLVFNFIDHTAETFFRNIHKLPAGHKIIIKDGRFELFKWYELKENINYSISEKEIYDKFYELLYDSVRLRLRSDVEVGSCLSGGLDSSAIVCIMNDILHEQGKTDIQKTYTAAYKDPKLDERKFVEQVIKQTGAEKHYLFPDTEGLMNDMDDLYYHQDEPFTSLSIYAQYCVFKKIHETGLKVVLDGQGADEILLGYHSFYPFYLKKFSANPLKFTSEFMKGADISALGYNRFAQNFVYFNTPSVRYKHVTNNAAQYVENDFLKGVNRKNLFYETISGDLTKNRFSNLWQISLPSLLRYEDKNSMAFSVEARLPFLDHRLVEFIFTIPFEYLIHEGWTKYVLRQSMIGKIPEGVRMRKGKLAFSVPQKEWMERLKVYIKENYTDEFYSSAYLSKNKMMEKLNAFNYNDKFFFRAFSLEKWMRVFELK